MAEIYGLYSARDGKVRYVGQTGGTRDARFRKHVRVYVGQWTTLVYEWVHSEWKKGYPVESALLEWCEYEQRRDVEKVWISKFPDLLNERVYNFRGGTPPVIPEIKEYRRRFLFNVNGYRGVHWCRQLDRYCVLVYTGNGIDWLDGDGAPNSESDIWFSDRIQALRARHSWRRWQKCKNWLPDYVEPDCEWSELSLSGRRNDGEWVRIETEEMPIADVAQW